MSADEFEAVKVRLEKIEHMQRRIADIVRRSLIAIVRIIEAEFNLPPVKL